MKFVEIYETQKKGKPVVICRLAWDGKHKRIIPLLNSAYAKNLFKEDSYLNKVTGKRIRPTHSLKFLKSLHDCFLNLSYIRASKLKRLKSARIAHSMVTSEALGRSEEAGVTEGLGSLQKEINAKCLRTKTSRMARMDENQSG